jgi:ureidoacrylate peracid hydrolase
MSDEKQKIMIDARPEPLGIDQSRAAILVIDMQNDFGSKGGMFDRAGIDISMIQRAVGPTAKVLAAGRQAGIPIVYIKMAFHPDLSDAGPLDSPTRKMHDALDVGKTIRLPDGRESRILIRDCWNTDIVPELAPEPGDVVLYKHRYSGFYQTELDTILGRFNAKYLVVTGCTTSVCVESTIRDAMFRDYTCLLLEDCTAEPVGADLPRTNHEASLLVMERLRFAWISKSEAFVRAMRPLQVNAHS